MTTRATNASDEIKRQFAVELLRHRNAWEAAMSVFQNDVKAAIEAEHLFMTDPIVIEHINKLQADKNLSVLPTKDDLCRELWKIGKAPVEGEAKKTVAERLSALKLYAEVMEYTGKSNGAPVQIQNNTAPRVLVVPQFGSPEEWEEKAKYQQRRLIEQAHGNVGATQH